MSIILNWINTNQDILALLFVILCILLLCVFRNIGIDRTDIFTILCVGYIFCVLYKTVFSRTPRNVSWNLEFGWSYRALLAHNAGMFSQIYLNIMLFIPLGCFAEKAFMKKKNSCIVALILGLMVTITIEFLQSFLKRGLFELDDIFNNMLGAAIGVGIARSIRHK